MKTATILLAAGKGTRMKSKLLKVLHPLGGKPMLWHPLQAVRKASSEKPTLVIGYQAEKVKETFGDRPITCSRKSSLAPAMPSCRPKASWKAKADLVIVLFGDMPLLQAETITKLIESNRPTPARSAC